MPGEAQRENASSLAQALRRVDASIERGELAVALRELESICRALSDADRTEVFERIGAVAERLCERGVRVAGRARLLVELTQRRRRSPGLSGDPL